jgi:hypothetical protein
MTLNSRLTFVYSLGSYQNIPLHVRPPP